jgi:hypothetical protein
MTPKTKCAFNSHHLIGLIFDVSISEAFSAVNFFFNSVEI